MTTDSLRKRFNMKSTVQRQRLLTFLKPYTDPPLRVMSLQGRFFLFASYFLTALVHHTAAGRVLAGSDELPALTCWTKEYGRTRAVALYCGAALASAVVGIACKIGLQVTNPDVIWMRAVSGLFVTHFLMFCFYTVRTSQTIQVEEKKVQ
eukprot:TRINITY_DN3246_c0_g1_i1.p1 TRINITY_DN3246_c0_g1~~TRINITY_DN3246_c0_g1_i1.p1  ORF type:complete len:150 (-),score=20.75 TRINITY_DN3246_c0_g1_i1:108-557(-)